MKGARRRWGMAAVVAGLLTVLSGCVATGPGYGGDVGVYGADYYEPDVYVYGGRWNPGYHVAPPRRGREVHPPRTEAPTRAAHPAFRAAPSSRPAPSIPSRPRGR